ncbi:MAG: tetratricopeptide repeat protein [Candidatus Polarisedimenticolia bacterium]
MPSKETRLAAALVLATVVAYLPALGGGYVWDDDVHVTHNDALRSMEGLRAIWFQPGATPQYYPLTFTSFWLEQRIWGLHPAGSHLVNVLLHAVTALLVGLTLRRLRVPGAWLAAAVFALHPVHAESVAWITERKNVLSGLFYLGSLLAFLRFVPLEPEQDSRRRRWLWYAVSLVLFVAALTAKTVTCSLPAVLVLLVWWKRPGLVGRSLPALVPFAAAGILLGLHTVWVERHHIGAAGQEWSLSWMERCLVAGRALWFYAGKLLVPMELTFIYPRWDVQAGSLLQILFPLAALGALALICSARSRLGRGPVVASLFFAGTLVPALGFFDTYPMRFSFVADHFQYLASMGPIALVSAGAAVAASRLRMRPAAGAALALALLVTLGSLTWRQAGIYRNAETLWTDTIRKNPGAWIARNNLGLILFQRDDLTGARAHFAQALELNPRYPEAHFNLGLMLARQNDLASARQHFEAASRLRPDHLDTQLQLGVVLARQGELAQAEERLLLASALRPDQPDIQLNLGVIYGRQGRLKDAADHFTQALRLDPSSKSAHHNLGLALMQTGEVDDAILHFAAAARLDPDLAEAHEELAWATALKSDWRAAARSFEEGLRLRPGSATSRFGLGAVLALDGREGEGAVQLQEAARIDSGWPVAAARVAWKQATSTRDALRNGALALQLAREASRATGERDPRILDTLAAAQAETGRYIEAAGTARRALRQAAGRADSAALTEGIAGRLALYEAGRPYRENGIRPGP